MEQTGGRTKDPLLAAFILAATVNRQSGGMVVAPWEIAGLLEEAPEWVYAAQALEQYQRDRQSQQTAEAWQKNYIEAWRNKHPAYRGKRQ